MTTNFSAKIHLRSSPLYPETDCNNALLILTSSSALVWLHRVLRKRTPLVDQQFGYLRLAVQLLDLVMGINTEFCRAISTQFPVVLWKKVSK